MAKYYWITQNFKYAQEIGRESKQANETNIIDNWFRVG